MYRFLFRNLWKKKLEKCNQAFDEYLMYLVLIQD